MPESSMHQVKPETVQHFTVADHMEDETYATTYVTLPNTLTVFEILHLRMLENIGETLGSIQRTLEFVSATYAGRPREPQR